jgi:hypothetical protein
MWTEIKTAYRDSWTVAVKFPLLFALPAAAEFAQHVVEYRLGMFASLEGMQAAADSGWRMGFGIVKVLSLFLLIYWVSRALAALRGAPLRVPGDARSALLFAGVLAWGLGTGMLQLFGGDLIAPFASGRAAMIIGAVFGVALLICDLYLSAWKIGASLGNDRLTFTASFRIMYGNFWWSLGYFVLMFLPLMVVHYALNFLAVGQPPIPMWATIGFDGLIVGYLGIVMTVATYVIAGRAATRKGETLLPQGVPEFKGAPAR